MIHPYKFDPSYGYNLKQLLKISAPTEPRKFDDFWLRRYQQALTQETKPELKDTGNTHNGWRVFKVNYQSTDAFTISGWLLLPESGIIKSGFVIGHGYGGRDQPDFHLPFKDAALFFPCFRGLSLSAKDPVSTDPYWHVLHNINSINDYIIGGCVEDIWLAVTAMLRLFPQLSGHLSYMGISFSGGLGILAMAYEKRINKAHVNVPTFGHHPLRLKLPSIGSARSQQQFYLKHKKQTLKVLRYYDAVTAAKRIKMPIHFACALFDPVVAPPGQFAIYNATQASKQLFVLEAGHHNYPNRKNEEKQLIKQLKFFFKPLKKL